MFFKQRILTYMSIIATLALLIALPTSAETSGSLGFNLNQVVDDLSGGLTADYEYKKVDRFDVEIESQLAFGSIYRGKLTAAVTFDLGSVGIKLASKNVGKGYELASMGRNQTVSAGLNVPIGNLEFDVGLGGKNAAPWGAPNLLNDALPLGYDEGELEAINAASITPAPRGLPPRDVSALVALVGTEFEWQSIEADVRGVFELTGEEKGHQVITHFQTSKAFDSFELVLMYEYGLLLLGGDIHSEAATAVSVQVPF